MEDYLSLQDETNDPTELDEIIQDLSAFHKVSPGIYARMHHRTH